MKRTLIAILFVLLTAACIDGTRYIGHPAPPEGGSTEGPLSEECFNVEARNFSRGDRDLGRYCREEN